VGSWIGQTIRRRAEGKAGQGSGNRVVSYSTRLSIREHQRTPKVENRW
jgi:hypothetical protein